MSKYLKKRPSLRPSGVTKPKPRKVLENAVDVLMFVGLCLLVALLAGGVSWLVVTALRTGVNAQTDAITCLIDAMST